MTISEAMRSYRLPNPTTLEDLESRWSKVIRYDEKVILAGHYYKGINQPSFFCAVYEFLDDNEEHTCESAIGLNAATDVIFEDEGHAIFWGMMK